MVMYDDAACILNMCLDVRTFSETNERISSLEAALLEAGETIESLNAQSAANVTALSAMGPHTGSNDNHNGDDHVESRDLPSSSSSSLQVGDDVVALHAANAELSSLVHHLQQTHAAQTARLQEMEEHVALLRTSACRVLFCYGGHT